MNEAELFADALEVTDPLQRAELLDRLCAGQPALRQRVERLLALHEADGQFLEPASVDIANEPTMSFVRQLSDTSPSKFIPTEPTTMSLGNSSNIPLAFRGYDVDGEIGRGGMGLVLKAHDKKLVRDVAIKVLAPHLAANTEAVQRFLREAQSAARVKHENVVTIYSIDDDAHQPFLVMEFVDGESLQRRLLRKGTLPAREAAEIARQTALGLAAAHAKGLVHRDVKPGNVLLEGVPDADETTEVSQPRVKLTDFGLARAVDDNTLTQSGFIAGTPQYMSPEQANSTGIDHRSDLFSLGGVLFAMLTGKPPFAASSTVALLRKIVDASPQTSDSRDDPEAAPLWLIIDKLLAKDPDQRFQSATEVAQELARFLAQEPLLIAPSSNADNESSSDSSSESNPRRRKEDLVADQAQRLPIGWVLVGVALLISGIWWLPLLQPRDQQPSPSNSSVAAIAELASTTSNADSREKPSNSNDTNDGTELKVPTVVEPPMPKPHFILSNDFAWEAPVNLGPGINTAGGEDHACISSDGLIMIFVRFEKPSSDLWWSVREKVADPFPPASRMPDGVNSPDNESDPFLSSDGLSLWFSSDRSQALRNKDIYVARRRSLKDDFDAPTRLDAPINSSDSETSPFATPDELSIFFARGSMPRRIYYATRKDPSQPFDAPKLVTAMSTFNWHEFPRLMPDGLTLIAVVSPGERLQHLWASFRPTPDSDFGLPVALDAVINERDGFISGPSWCEATSTLYFSSQRSGGQGGRDLWSSRRIKRQPPKPLPPSIGDKQAPSLAVAPFGPDEARRHQDAWAQHLKADVEIENSIGMKLKLIPPGEFLMGAPEDDPDAQQQEKPQHAVRLTRPFFMGETEVTVGQFQKFVESEKNVTMAESDQLGAFEVASRSRTNSVVWNKLPTNNSDQHPVRCVGWEDAVKFCEWLSKTDGHTYRLPTDAEWEYACRAGTTTRYCFANEFDVLKANSAYGEVQGTKGARPVASYLPNAFGLFDMHGNVNEICWDSGRSFTADGVVDPIGSLDRTTAAVVRGGAVSSHPARLRSSQRYLTDARTFPDLNFATSVKGFRVLREAVLPETK